ncbi:MAG TPA: hypothetical protein DDW67_01235 [Elusimicrobia bacterium]|jgi:hypothetical protein|nr:hypothetical protein [Elusimicrobiota bacterium]
MDRNTLVLALKDIRIPPEAAEEYGRKAAKMAGAVTERLLARPDLESLIGKNNSEMMKDNHANHARFIESMLRNFDAETMTDTVLWVFRAYRSHGFHDSYWAAQLNQWHAVLRENLSDNTLRAVLPLYDWMQVNIPAFSALAERQKAELKGQLQ